MKVLHIGGAMHGQVLEAPEALVYTPAGSEQAYVLGDALGVSFYYPASLCWRRAKAYLRNHLARTTP